MKVPTLVVVAIAALVSARQPPIVRGAGPLPQFARPAIAAIIDAFSNYHLVAIGEVHRNEQVHDFIVSLLNDRRFLPAGGDIVVEFGNARYQTLIDRYIAGNDVPRSDLAHVWRDTVNILVWDAPVYERLFTKVRAINQGRRPRSRLRVVLADPPIDWSAIHDRGAWEQIAAARDRHAADVIEREVLARGRRALLIFGSGHVQDERAFDAFGKSSPIRSPNIAELLEREHPHTTLFVLADPMSVEFDRRVGAWQPPVLARLKGTWFGDVHVGPPGITPRFADLADEFLYFGSTASMTTSTPPVETYRDEVYMRELQRRDQIQGGANTIELRRIAVALETTPR